MTTVEAGPYAIATGAPSSRVAVVVVRRIVGGLVALLLLVLLLPLLLVVGAAVRLTSPGPALFVQERVGLQRRPFIMYKFRTMAVDGDDAEHRAYVRSLLTGEGQAQQGGVFKLADARVTPLGRLLRHTSIDELPQLLNVVRGDMGLVGPRPMLDYEVELLPAWSRERFAVRPGMTGLWQVSGRSDVDFLTALRMDVDYVRRRSALLDVSILLRTVVVLLRRPAAR